MSLAATTTAPTGLTNKHNDSNNSGGDLHVGIPYRNAPTHSSCPLKHQAPPQSWYHHCQTIYNQPMQASWISPDEDDEDDDEDEVDTESGSDTPPIKDNAAAVVGRYEALLDDEAITKSYLDPPCISPPPITTLEKTKTTSKLSQIKSRIQSTPTTTTMRNKDEGLDKGALLTRTVERDAAIASRPSLSPLPTPPPSTTPRSPLPMGGSSSSSLHSRSSLAQRNMIMRSGSLPSLSYHHQQQQQQHISSMLSSTSTCSSSSASSDPLFSAGTGSSSNSSNGEANDSFSPVPSSSSSSRLKLAFQKLRGRHSSAATKNNEPIGPSLSDKSTSRKSTCSTITTKSSPTRPAPTKSTSLAKRIRSKFNKSKSPKKTTTTTTTTNRVSRTTSLTSVATWSYPEQQQSHPFNKGDTTKRLVSNQERSLRHNSNNKHRSTQQHWPHNHPHHYHHHHHHHHPHRHNLQQQQQHTPPVTLSHHQRMMQPMPSMSSPPPSSKGAIPRATSDMLLSCSQQQQPSPMPLAASDTSVVRFARVVSVKETFSRYEYDRGSDPDAVCTRLTPAMAQYIKQELNMYKLNEMPVHEQSRVHTHFFL